MFLYNNKNNTYSIIWNIGPPKNINNSSFIGLFMFSSNIVYPPKGYIFIFFIFHLYKLEIIIWPNSWIIIIKYNIINDLNKPVIIDESARK